MAHRPEWQLPVGVTQGVWEYTQAPHIAEGYDEDFATNRLFDFDEQVLAHHFRRPGWVIDLGCGTGRALMGLARRGFPGLGVDLSPTMLRIVSEKARGEGLPIACLRANLVELDCLRDGSFDYAICLFSTVGMVRGRANRHRALVQIRRILKPGGLFVVHVHNVWFNLFDPLGRRWLRRHLPDVLLRRDVELGDKFFHYQGIPQLFLHTFTQGELVGSLRRARFGIRELIPLNVGRQRPLPHRWFLGRFRANGWIAVCE